MLNPSVEIASEGIVHRPPSRILLATDFTARCDRAQHRAVQLATEWDAGLTVVHAVDDVSLSADPSAHAAYKAAACRNARRLREELVVIEGLRSCVHVDIGTPATVIRKRAARERADLIVAGHTRSMLSGELSIGSTLTALARSSGVPVLVVKKKVFETRARALLTTDLTASSGPAMQLALNWFPDTQHRLFHAFDPPYRMWAEDKASYARKFEQSALDECARFVTKAAGAMAQDRFDISVRCGDVVDALRPLVDEADVDLVIAGTHSRTGVMNLLLGSVASRIVNEIQSDVLIVPSSLQ
ncbi:universal stress protein [Rhizobium sp. BR 362]|uniref:universal stress protein n=1 Tax=Rhizobium sp. BR 362 TaxID=3040670 RepID=UPI002F4132FE